VTKRQLCEKCFRPIAVCYCKNLPVISNLWPVYILQHIRESKHPLSTTPIAQLGLKNCQLLAIKNPIDDNQVETWLNQTPVLVYPSENSLPLESLEITLATPLLFLDGTWRKTRRMIHESHYLSQLQKIHVSPTQPSCYKIRKAPNPNALSTLETIIHVLSFLEKKPDKYQPLMETMELMINKQIESMGREVFEKNYK